MKPGTVQRIFNDHYPALNASRRLDARSRWAAWNIRTCRTPAQGFHVDACPNDGYRIQLNNSCRHRACTLCGATETELWRWNRKAFTGYYFRDKFLVCLPAS